MADVFGISQRFDIIFYLIIIKGGKSDGQNIYVNNLVDSRFLGILKI